MVQEYEIEYEDNTPTTTIKPTTKRKEKTDDPLGDVFDVYGMVSNVHSKQTNMTRDYVLASYTTDVINAKFPKFVREQRKTLRVIKSYLLVQKSELLKRFNEKYVEYALKTIENIYYDIEELLLGELDEMVIISRAGKGEVKTAMLMHGRTNDEREEFKAEMTEGVKEKLLEKTK